MLEGNLPARLRVCNVLLLSSILLDEVVRHKESRQVVRNCDTHPVAIRNLALVRAGKSAPISRVCEILEHRRVQVTICMETITAEREPVSPPCIRDSCGIPHSRRSSPTCIDSAVQPGRNILFRGHLNDSAELSSILCGITRSQYAHRLYIACIKRWRKGRRTIFRERHSVQDVLHVILRTSRMQNAVPLVQPSRQVIDEVGEMPSWLPGDILGQSLISY